MDLRLDLRATSADLFLLSFLSPPPHGLGNPGKKNYFQLPTLCIVIDLLSLFLMAV
jgi:hypothetical protein